MLKFKSVSITKFGNTPEENEDNILKPGEREIKSDSIFKFAVSDGATESSFSKEWSDLLVSAYKDMSFDKSQLQETINAISESWQAKVNTLELPWYANQKAEYGAFATFLGLTINTEQNSFEAISVGDCLLFNIRNNKILHSFPFSTIDEFNNTPSLIATNEKYQIELNEHAAYYNGEIQKGDIIILATDAIAVWILQQKYRDCRIIQKLLNQFENQDEKTFENWLNQKRRKNLVKNDDVTLLIITFE